MRQHPLARQTPIRACAQRLGLRAAIVLALLAGLAGGGWLWLRDSSLVAVQRVTIVGAGGSQGAEIRTALELAARNMTTLDLRLSALRAAVAPYPSVSHLRVTASFPHAIRIRVFERRSVAVLSALGTSVGVADDGTVLRNAPVQPSLPVIALAGVPAGPRVTGIALSEVRLLAAAPRVLLAHVGRAWSDPVHGLWVQLRSGPRIYFGGAGDLSAKWAAAAAVLAAPSSAGAPYIDVTVAARPAAGSGGDGVG
ncbi:MAG: cell division protein FtsQ/DivIB [Solirubrobacteraceae bacterium]